MEVEALKDALATALQKHDWFYSYSDDYSVYKKGEKEAAEIYAMMQKMGQMGHLREAMEVFTLYKQD